MAYPLSNKTYHFNAHFNFYGVTVLIILSGLVLTFSYLNDLTGVFNIAVLPLLLGVFTLGMFTGRPCLRVEQDYFQYRAGPFGRLYHVEVDEIEYIAFEDGKIKIYGYGLHKPVVCIRSNSFKKAELSSVNEYFVRLKQYVGAKQDTRQVHE